eukprot:TRINITY_DN3094_c0_g1_i1.p1 TRINITY_DN3094_c0_g1~~TRINITY_DN3094_c0_g1_i1.p1  ORF type:complete len:164 (-),score=30.26 TRINITY_DN3094_c0_g1_i1:237-728(-)
MFTVAKTVGVSGAANMVPSSKVKHYAKFIALGVCVALVVLGVIGLIFKNWVIGPIMIVEAFVMLTLELPIVQIAWILNFFQDYRWRGVMYVLFCIPTFFSVITFLAGLGCIAIGLVYVFLGFFKKEKGTPIERPVGGAQGDVENQKDQRKSGLSSKGAAPGVI